MKLNKPVIAVTGGKGGTGKSTIATNLSVVLANLGYEVLLIDADVDGPCDAKLLGLKLNKGKRVYSLIPKISGDKCIACGRCIDACENHALIKSVDGSPKLFEELCCGCGACILVCPVKAISEGQKEVGCIYSAKLKGITLYVGELKPVEPRSRRVVEEVKNEAFKEADSTEVDLVFIDTSPGIHISVAQALRGVNYALVVTEPTPMGLHDLKLLINLTKLLRVSSGVVINKCDIKGGIKNSITNACRELGVKVLEEIPFDESMVEFYVKGKPIVTGKPNSPASLALKRLAEKIISMFLNK